MSDPFDRLRASGPGPDPDVDAIKSRARRIERRRYAGLGGGAVAIVLIAVVGIVLSTGPRDSARKLATGADATPTTQAFAAEDQSRRTEAQLEAGVVPSDPAGFVGTTAAPGAVTGSTGAGASESAPQAGGAAAARSADQAPSGFEVTLEVSGPSVGRGARFTLRACNTSNETRELTFPSGQRYDFEVSRNGELVWRWSDGRAFTQVYGTEQWGPGQCKTYNDSWDGRTSDGGVAPPGSYQAVGIVASSPQLRSAPKTFCLDAC